MTKDELRDQAPHSHLHRVVYLMFLQNEDSQRRYKELEVPISAATYHQTSNPQINYYMEQISKLSKSAKSTCECQIHYLDKASKALEIAVSQGITSIEKIPSLNEALKDFEKESKTFDRRAKAIQGFYRDAQKLMT